MGTVTAISRGGVTLMIPLVLSCVVQSERVVSESETGVPSAAMVAEQSPVVDPKRFEGVDSVTVGRKVDHLTDTLTSVSRDGRFEAAATRQRDSNAPIVVVGERMRSGSSSRVGLIELAEWEAFPSMRWIAPNERSTPQLVLSWQRSGEGTTGSRVYEFTRGAARLLYDDEGQACEPIRTMDVDADGALEIVRFPDPRGSCLSGCLDAKYPALGQVPVWVEVLEWAARGWQSKESGTAQFYDSVATVYAQIAREIARDDSVLCRGMRDELLSNLSAWTARARTLARGGASLKSRN